MGPVLLVCPAILDAILCLHLLRYDDAFGSPVARAEGAGYVLELLSRLTHTPITATSGPTSNPSVMSVNTTLDSNPTTFPLNNALYSDATHETVMMNIYTALNLTVLAQDGPLSATQMKRKRSWNSSRFAPFGSNMQIQCEHSFSIDHIQHLMTIKQCSPAPILIPPRPPQRHRQPLHLLRTLLSSALSSTTPSFLLLESKGALNSRTDYVPLTHSSLVRRNWWRIRIGIGHVMVIGQCLLGMPGRPLQVIHRRNHNRFERVLPCTEFVTISFLDISYVIMVNTSFSIGPSSFIGRNSC